MVLVNQIRILSQRGRPPARRPRLPSADSGLVGFFCRGRRDSVEGKTLGAEPSATHRHTTERRRPRTLWLALGILALVMSGAAPLSAGNSVRISGQTHSIAPSDDVLLISVPGTHGSEEMVWINVRNAKVVRLWRDPARRWEWLERTTSLYWLPTNTFVTVFGREGPWGIIRASRIEVPELDSE